MSWWSWGADANVAGRAGYVLDGTNPVVLDAQMMALPDDIVAVVAQRNAGAALTSGGEIWVWGVANRAVGDPGHGVFGDAAQGVEDGSGFSVSPPIRLDYSQATSVKQVALTEAATFWLRTDGTVWGVGANWNGEFGTGEDCTSGPIYHATPIHLTGLPAGIKRIYAATFTYGLFAIDASDRLWYAGYDEHALSGFGTPHGPIAPYYYLLSHTLVNGLPASVVDVVVARSGSPGGSPVPFGSSGYARLTGGTVMWWGRSLIAGGPTTTLYTPSALTGVSGIQEMYSNGTSLFLRTTAGAVLGLGSDSGGSLSNGSWSGPAYGPTSSYTRSDHYTLPPVSISLPGGRTATRLCGGSDGADATFVITSDQQVWGWGRNDYFWGDSDPTGDAENTATIVSPPYPVFQDVYNAYPDVPNCPPSDVTVMFDAALFVNACSPVTVSIPSRLATIVG